MVGSDRGCVRRVRAADGSPGVRTTLGGQDVFVYDALPGPNGLAGVPGTIAARQHGAVLVRTGDGTIWVGQVRLADAPRDRSIKLPASIGLSDHLGGVPELIGAHNREAAFRDISDDSSAAWEWCPSSFYNGAMSSMTAAAWRAPYGGPRRRTPAYSSLGR